MTSPHLAVLLTELMRRTGRGMALGLERMRSALDALGRPQEIAPFVHVAGTNGKGSTCAMVEAIARASGLRTGLYTSPHLCRFAERIRIDGEPISDEALASALERAFAASPEATFFEAMTLAAFVAFAEAKVEFGVLEVGLGGRLDATNVLEAPLCTAVTSIGFDHTALLGDTLGAIAREKAGIFRRGVPAVLGPLGDEALAATLEVAESLGAGPILRVARPGEAIGEGVFEAQALAEGQVRIALPEGQVVETQLALSGAHQVGNAAVAAAIAAVTGAARFPAMRGAIAKGISTAVWPGRLERITQGGASVLLDCAHNPHGAETLAAHVRAKGPGPARTILVFGALADKAWTGMLDIVGPLADRRIYTAPKGRAAAPLDEMGARFAGEAVSEPAEAIARGLALAGPGDLVVVAGSIYLVGEVRAALLGITCDPVVAL
jgi:dihydrofolate synthase/folylpolyglutamate synthase